MTSIEIVKIGIQIATFLATLIIGFGGIWAFIKITKNHLAHIDVDLKGIIKSVDENKKNINDLNVSVANLQGRFGEKV